MTAIIPESVPQITSRGSALPERPQTDPRRPRIMSALALAEHLVSLGNLPDSIAIECRPWDAEATVVAHAFHDIALLHDWQRRFGGELHHELQETANRTQALSTLTGRAYDAPFRVWTLRDVQVTPETEAAEAELCAQWIGYYGDPSEWSLATRRAYVLAVEQSRVDAAL